MDDGYFYIYCIQYHVDHCWQHNGATNLFRWPLAAESERAVQLCLSAHPVSAGKQVSVAVFCSEIYSGREHHFALSYFSSDA